MEEVPKRWVLGIFVLLLVVPAVSATELGMNYYHESMMGEHGRYIYRSIDDVGHDFDDIKAIAHHLKFYMNPFFEENKLWVDELVKVASKKGMKSTVAMNVDDRLIGDDNWDWYKGRVLDSCSFFSGKAERLFVGNEMTLHSDWSDQTIKDHILPLIYECEDRFKGEVSYEEFWYAHEVWKGYPGLISFNLYEDLSSFETNLKELDKEFGSNVIIGEFGEDLWDNGNEKDEGWQGYQVGERWKKLQASKTPIAFLFSYREPTQLGFGLLRGDGSKKPAWNALKGKDDGDGDKGKGLNELSISCTANGNKCNLLEDSKGGCRTVRWGTEKGGIKVMACDKGDHFEVYRQEYPQGLDFKACFENTCVDEHQGYAELEKKGDDGEEDDDDNKQGDTIDVTQLSFHVEPSGTLLSDTNDGSCRRVTYDTPLGWIGAKACEKGDRYEMYLENYPTAPNVCVDKHCVGALGGFISFL